MADRRNIVIEQGATYTATYKLAEPGVTDFTGYVVDSQMRDTPAGDVLATFTVTWTNQATATPTLTFTLPATDTTALTAGTRGVHDARLTDPDGVVVSRLHEGTATVSPSVTRSA